MNSATGQTVLGGLRQGLAHFFGGRNRGATQKSLFQCREFFGRPVYLVPASEAANGINRRVSASRLSENFLFQTGESR